MRRRGLRKTGEAQHRPKRVSPDPAISIACLSQYSVPAAAQHIHKSYFALFDTLDMFRTVDCPSPQLHGAGTNNDLTQRSSSCGHPFRTVGERNHGNSVSSRGRWGRTLTAQTTDSNHILGDSLPALTRGLLLGHGLQKGHDE